MQTRLLRFLCAVLAVSLATGGECPMRDDDVVINGPRDLIKYYCAREWRCRDVNGRSYYSEQACIDVLNAQADCGLADGYSFRYFSVPTDPEASACARWMATAACDATDVDSSCLGAYHLQIDGFEIEYAGEGEVCVPNFHEYHGQPTSWRTCDFPFVCSMPTVDHGLCGVCKPPAAVGEPCGSGCVSGSFCSGDTNTCVVQTQVAPRERNATCGRGELCRGSLSCQNGVCADRPGLDEPCIPWEGCQKGLACHRGTCRLYKLCEYSAIGEPCGACVAGAYCDRLLAECQAPVAVGGACTDTSLCVAGAYCDLAAEQCKPLEQVGTSCATDMACGEGAYCDYISNLCTAYAAIGESCSGMAACNRAESFCDPTGGLVCTAFRDAGASCGWDTECQSSWCDTNSHLCTEQCSLQ